MNFDLDDEQLLFKGSVERLLANRYSFEQRAEHMRHERGYGTAIWQAFAELGLLAIPFDLDDGGLGMSPVETMIVMEAFGSALVIEPYLANVVLAGGILRRAPGGDGRAVLIAGIADGTRTAAFAHHERRARFDLAHVETRAGMEEYGWRINGEKSLVLNGDTADTLIVSARIAGAPTDRDGIALFLVDAADVARRSYATQDGMRAAEITLADAPGVPIGEPGAALPIIERVVDEAIAALCAEAVGAMRVLIDLTVDYLKTRQQFGVAIGSFQALQHRAAEMVVALEQARSMALFATVMASEDDATECARAIHAAKVQIGRSAKFVGEQAVQLHGGIGMTDDYKVGHYFKRLTMIGAAFGNADYHLARLAAMGGLSTT